MEMIVGNSRNRCVLGDLVKRDKCNDRDYRGGASLSSQAYKERDSIGTRCEGEVLSRHSEKALHQEKG